MIGSVVIIGSGNVAWHLALKFSTLQKVTVNVFGRHPERDKALFENLGDNVKYYSDIINVNRNASIYILCVNDDYIDEVAGQVPFRLNEHQMLVHCSGSVSSAVLSKYAINYGCFWPIQSLTKLVPTASKNLPIAITTNNNYAENTLKTLAKDIHSDFNVVTDADKTHLHLAAVMVNNFTNHIYTLAADYCDQKNIDFELLSPLIQETAHKALAVQHPSMVQTGPAARGDTHTVQKHLTLLHDHSELAKLYALFSQHILQKHQDI
ncbi:MAG: DUF2520 domain-containing protein [Saprospiraceae bacterium]